MERQQRKKRGSVRGTRDILAIADQDPNYVYRWAADDPQRPGRIERLKEIGYELVTDDVEVGQKAVDRNTKVGSVVTRTGGLGITLVLMRILKEWYDEDQAAKQELVDAREESMRQDVRQGRIPGSKEPGHGTLKIERR
jgi:hypothetical protein